MSFLTPLYIAGLAALSLPLLLHLIRRTPRGESTFSSLMFLSPSPPRVTRRSRIEHWLLLLLRGAALALLALAFARPFWRAEAQADDAEASLRRVAIVVDTSASMRRDALWPQALQAVDAALAQCRPQDQVAVFACDESLRPIAGFNDLAQVDPARRASVVQTRMAELQPTWAGTHLGESLLDVLALVNEAGDATEERGRAARRIVLVSDMQRGSRLNVLGEAPWPAEVQLVLRTVAANPPANAGLQRLIDDASDDSPAAAPGEALRIRVANAEDAATEELQLAWIDNEGETRGDAVAAYVPPGESRVVRVQRPDAADAEKLVLAGDAHAFDNTLYVVQEAHEETIVAYLGGDAADDPEGLRYYLERALTAGEHRDIRVETLLSEGAWTIDQPAAPALVVIGADPPAAQAEQLRAYCTDGGTVLYVVREPGEPQGLAALLGVAPFSTEEAEVDGFAMLGEIDFRHPMFAAMAGPQFNDFTQIRFWKYRRPSLPEGAEVHMIARFENGDPAIFETPIGQGRIVVMSAGWQPTDSQLARSWKFLLMLGSLVDGRQGAGALRSDYVVNERVRLPDRKTLPADASVTMPDGAVVQLAGDAQEFADTAQPGIYSLTTVDGPARFAVNLDPVESDTTPLAAEAFEQLGCRLEGSAASAADVNRMARLRDVELESRQRMWQWLVAATLGVLVAETLLAGWLSRAARGGLASS